MTVRREAKSVKTSRSRSQIASTGRRDWYMLWWKTTVIRDFWNQKCTKLSWNRLNSDENNVRKKKLVRRLSEWLILHFSRLSLESQFKQKRLVCQRMQKWKEIQSSRFEDWQDLKAKHNLNNVLHSFWSQFYVDCLILHKKGPVIQKKAERLSFVWKGKSWE